MEEAPENGKELSHSARANGMNECKLTTTQMQQMLVKDKKTLRAIIDMYHIIARSLVTSLTT